VALVVRGKSTCTLCGGVLAKDDAIVGLPPFLTPEHRLWRFSDSAMHAACFAASADKGEVEELLERAREEWRARVTPEGRAERARILAEERATRDRDDREHNARHERIMAVVRVTGATCPHCGARAALFRELTGTARLRLACRACGRSCAADDLVRAATD
jgi:hypothetical protein